MNNQQLDELFQQAKSPDPDIRFEAIGELTYYHSPEIDEALVHAAGDADPDVAGTALDALAERGHPKARDLVLTNLQSRNRRIRFSALRTAGVVDISPHLELAWEALDTRRWVDRVAGAGALAKAGVVAVLPKIRDLAQYARAVKEYSAEAHLLGSAALLGDHESADLFLARLSAKNRMSRLSAAAFLERRDRLEEMARIVGNEQLRNALISGRQVQEHSSRPGYAREFDELLERLGKMQS